MRYEDEGKINQAETINNESWRGEFGQWMTNRAGKQNKRRNRLRGARFRPLAIVIDTRLLDIISPAYGVAVKKNELYLCLDIQSEPATFPLNERILVSSFDPLLPPR